MDAEQWAAFMEEVNADMQTTPLGGASGAFPLAPPAKGKAGKVRQGFLDKAFRRVSRKGFGGHWPRVERWSMTLLYG